MKTFFNLVQEVQKPGLCHHCGACVAFCTAVNYGALELDDQGQPRYKDMYKCIECGLCYSICPAINELEAEVKKKLAWSEPIGRVMEVTVARAKDPSIREQATDGGAVTALLLHLFDLGRIDGAIVAKKVGPFKREPLLATTREEIIEAAGFFFETSHSMGELSTEYTEHASVELFNPLLRKGLRRVALVASPCQIQAFRKMQVLGVMPADSIRICLGLFCSGNFNFGPVQRKQLAELGSFNWDDVKKINIKEKLLVHLNDGQIKKIDLEKLSFMKRFACHFCLDYSAQFADISFGGIGAKQGWTTIIARTPEGRAAFEDAKGHTLEEYTHKENPSFATEALTQIHKAAALKRKAGRRQMRELAPQIRLEK